MRLRFSGYNDRLIGGRMLTAQPTSRVLCLIGNCRRCEHRSVIGVSSWWGFVRGVMQGCGAGARRRWDSA
jgi:hypothetical protein